MSELTAPALATLDRLLPALEGLPAGPGRDRLVEESQALRRAVAAFHMEAIRFRMYSVDRFLRSAEVPEEARTLFDRLRAQLEAAGFHTRSHASPSSPERSV